MAHVQPLCALRYSPAAGDIAQLATLPYDVIPPALEADYKGRSPYNFAHLILPQGDYAGAAAKLSSWKHEGIVARDAEPAFFVYEQTFPAPGTGEILTRRGFIGLGDTEDYGTNVFRHEWTMSGPKEDRFRLLQATQVQFDSIFMLFPDPAGTVEAKLSEICATEPSLAYSDHEHTGHKLWRVTDPAWIASLQALMSDRPLLIADGHHRYETALRMGQPHTLMTFVSLQSPGLRCFATHRIVHSLPDFQPDAFLASLPNAGSGLDPLVSPPGAIRFGIAMANGEFHCDVPVPEGALNVAVLQESILTPLLGISPAVVAAGTNLRYKRTREEALAEVREGRAQITFLLEDLPIDGMARVSFGGQVLPQKSTYFYPKLGSGLVMLELES
ncbi:DUF1015 domain-containing protein [uncultured Paludibaculum sp.]|uniref:DUF1015 domain-containing protein n=1 Tax=uncultured Paludibaculum sp. TaxID=1765020 RepID=UPI002AAA9686|nr:DUF1015 domain-containing protein [uncultured Paludibaculum sp.]